MKTLKINPLAILAGIVAGQIVPAIWYMLVAQSWMQLSGLTEAQAQAAGSTPYIISVVGSILGSTFMAYIFRDLRVESVQRGGLLGMGFGFFFSGIDLFTISAFQQHSLALAILNGVHLVLVYGVVGAILGGWRSCQAAPVSVPSSVDA